jgi:hypothetical protein
MGEDPEDKEEQPPEKLSSRRQFFRNAWEEVSNRLRGYGLITGTGALVGAGFIGPAGIWIRTQLGHFLINEQDIHNQAKATVREAVEQERRNNGRQMSSDQIIDRFWTELVRGTEAAKKAVEEKKAATMTNSTLTTAGLAAGAALYCDVTDTAERIRQARQNHRQNQRPIPRPQEVKDESGADKGTDRSGDKKDDRAR